MKPPDNDWWFKTLVVTAFALWLAAGAVDVIAEEPPDEDARVSPGFCYDGTRNLSASYTEVGGATVTAYHWAGNKTCKTAFPDNPGMRHFPAYDITVLKPGALPKEGCRDASQGEPVAYLGYPGTDQETGDWLNPLRRPLETDSGVVLATGLSVPVTDGKGGNVRLLQGISVGTSSKVRQGYSGGPVVSLNDGRIVGIINAVGAGNMPFYTPISTICNLIEESKK